MVWHAAQWFRNVYSPTSNVARGTSANEGSALVAPLFQPSSQSLIVRARKPGLSRAEFLIHWPLGSLPTSTLGVCPSGFSGFGSEYSPSFLLINSMSAALPVRNVHPGPT